MNQDDQRKLAIECGAGTSQYIVIGEDVIYFRDHELAVYTAAIEAPLQARIDELQNQNTFDAIRLRTLASKCGIAVPESNEELLCVAGVVLGTIRRVIDGVYERDNLLQARIAQLEDALQAWLNEKDGYALNEALTKKTSSTWLSEHDKEVEARMLKNMIDADTEGWICSGSFKGMLVEMLKARGLK